MCAKKNCKRTGKLRSSVRMSVCKTRSVKLVADDPNQSLQKRPYCHQFFGDTADGNDHAVAALRTSGAREARKRSWAEIGDAESVSRDTAAADQVYVPESNRFSVESTGAEVALQRTAKRPTAAKFRILVESLIGRSRSEVKAMSPAIKKQLKYLRRCGCLVWGSCSTSTEWSGPREKASCQHGGHSMAWPAEDVRQEKREGDRAEAGEAECVSIGTSVIGEDDKGFDDTGAHTPKSKAQTRVGSGTKAVLQRAAKRPTAMKFCVRVSNLVGRSRSEVKAMPPAQKAQLPYLIRCGYLSWDGGINAIVNEASVSPVQASRRWRAGVLSLALD